MTFEEWMDGRYPRWRQWKSYSGPKVGTVATQMRQAWDAALRSELEMEYTRAIEDASRICFHAASETTSGALAVLFNRLGVEIQSLSQQFERVSRKRMTHANR